MNVIDYSRRRKGVSDFFKAMDISGLTGLVTCPCEILRTRDGVFPNIDTAFTPVLGAFDLTSVRFGNIPLRRVTYLDQFPKEVLTELRHKFEEKLDLDVNPYLDRNYRPNAFNLSNPQITDSSVDSAILRIGYVLSLYRIR